MLELMHQVRLRLAYPMLAPADTPFQPLSLLRIDHPLELLIIRGAQRRGATLITQRLVELRSIVPPPVHARRALQNANARLGFGLLPGVAGRLGAPCKQNVRLDEPGHVHSVSFRPAR